MSDRLAADPTPESESTQPADPTPLPLTLEALDRLLEQRDERLRSQLNRDLDHREHARRMASRTPTRDYFSALSYADLAELRAELEKHFRDLDFKLLLIAMFGGLLLLLIVGLIFLHGAMPPGVAR